MSVRPSAKPIVRRQAATTSPPSKVLLTIPHFRDALTPETSNTADEKPEDSGKSSTNDALARHETPGARRDDVLESLEMAVAYQQATGDHPLGNQEVGSQEVGATGPPALTVNQLEASASQSKSHTKSRSKRNGPSFDVADTTHETFGGFSNTLRQNLGVLGTIAASIVVCTLVARGMKQENGSRNLVASNQPSAELNDVVPAAATESEVVTAVTPNFDLTQGQRQTLPQQVNPRTEPVGVQTVPTLQQPANAQRNNFQNQSAVQAEVANPRRLSANSFSQRSEFQGQGNAIAQSTQLVQPTRLGTAAARPATEGSFDPFALPAFQAKPGEPSQNNAVGSVNPNQNPQQVRALQTLAQQEQQRLLQQQALAAQQQQPAPAQFRSAIRQTPNQFAAQNQAALQNQVPVRNRQQPQSTLPTPTNAASNPYPSTAGASFREIAADPLNSRFQQELAVGLPNSPPANRFSNPQNTNVPSQVGQTADRENTQGYDARFGTSQTGTNTGVFR